MNAEKFVFILDLLFGFHCFENDWGNNKLTEVC